MWEETGRYLGIAAAGILNAVNPDIIAIGGGVSNALDLMMPAVERELAWRTLAPYRDRTPIVPAVLGDDSALFGAATLALESFG